MLEDKISFLDRKNPLPRKIVMRTLPMLDNCFAKKFFCGLTSERQLQTFENLKLGEVWEKGEKVEDNSTITEINKYKEAK